METMFTYSLLLQGFWNHGEFGDRLHRQQFNSGQSLGYTHPSGLVHDDPISFAEVVSFVCAGMGHHLMRDT